jgi:ABC-type glycerol-3-phosphate transport system substrate-binding protein
VRRAGAAFNLLSGGVYTRTGFSPTWEWNGDFLYTAARLYGAVFEEGAPLSWERGTLTSAVARLKDWLNEENGGAQAEDDFVFKYSYNPPLRLIEQGRILFAYVKSNVLFTAPAEELEQLDFRWLAAEDTDGEKISVLEDVLLLGITKKCAAKNAAAAFVKWFYSDYTQRELLKGSKAAYMGAPIFGIASGFSAVRSVTESAFPPKYPALLAHIPPDDSLRAPPPLPWNWSNLKERVIVPYIRERVKTDEAPTRNLEQRLADWARMNNQILQAIRD